MRVIVLGAGVVGTTAAWALAEAGHEVTVIERREGAGLETSFANGGQISVSHAEPWASPSAPGKILGWLGRADAPLRFRPRADPAQWRWALAFLRECTPARFRRNVTQLVRLGLYSRERLRALRDETGIEYDQLSRGILHFYTDAAQLEHSERAARILRELGAARERVSVDEAVRVEPALAPVRDRLVGASWTADDESGDAHRFTQALAALAARRGVAFRWGLEAVNLVPAGDRIASVRVRDARTAPGVVSPQAALAADAFVIALATGSVALAATVGLRLDIQPAKGYSLTVPVVDPERAPTVSLTDDEYKIVFTRLGERLRIAGTAELGSRSPAPDPVRCDALARRGLALFGDACAWDDATRWAGLRPSTPSNVPWIGRAPGWSNLWLDTGHGTLGWTHAAGSAQALADLMSGRTPAVDFAFCGR